MRMPDEFCFKLHLDTPGRFTPGKPRQANNKLSCACGFFWPIWGPGAFPLDWGRNFIEFAPINRPRAQMTMHFSHESIYVGLGQVGPGPNWAWAKLVPGPKGAWAKRVPVPSGTGPKTRSGTGPKWVPGPSGTGPKWATGPIFLIFIFGTKSGKRWV